MSRRDLVDCWSSTFLLLILFLLFFSSCEALSQLTKRDTDLIWKQISITNLRGHHHHQHQCLDYIVAEANLYLFSFSDLDKETLYLTIMCFW